MPKRIAVTVVKIKNFSTGIAEICAHKLTTSAVEQPMISKPPTISPQRMLLCSMKELSTSENDLRGSGGGGGGGGGGSIGLIGSEIGPDSGSGLGSKIRGVGLGCGWGLGFGRGGDVITVTSSRIRARICSKISSLIFPSVYKRMICLSVAARSFNS